MGIALPKEEVITFYETLGSYWKYKIILYFRRSHFHFGFLVDVTPKVIRGSSCNFLLGLGMIKEKLDYISGKIRIIFWIPMS